MCVVSLNLLRLTVQKEDEVTPAKWDFDPTGVDRSDLLVSFSEITTLKVCIIILLYLVVHHLRQDTLLMQKLVLTDPRVPYNIDAIGMRTKVVQNNDLSDDIQCVSEAKYHLWQTAHLQETCDITTVPIYVLDW